MESKFQGRNGGEREGGGHCRKKQPGLRLGTLKHLYCNFPMSHPRFSPFEISPVQVTCRGKNGNETAKRLPGCGFVPRPGPADLVCCRF